MVSHFSQSSGQVVMGGVGGVDEVGLLSSVELFPPSNTCSIPDLPQPRNGHSLSVMSGGRVGGAWLVVCGGQSASDSLDSCISWVAGNESWTPLYTMRCFLIMRITFIKKHITVRLDMDLLPGRHPLFATPSFCWAASWPIWAMQQSLMPRLCRV